MNTSKILGLTLLVVTLVLYGPVAVGAFSFYVKVLLGERAHIEWEGSGILFLPIALMASIYATLTTERDWRKYPKLTALFALGGMPSYFFCIHVLFFDDPAVIWRLPFIIKVLSLAPIILGGYYYFLYAWFLLRKEGKSG